MPRLSLLIGNKNYSSWSMRPWVLLTQAGIPFDEVQLWLDDDAHVIGAGELLPARKVPVLVVDGERVWDSLAICETVAELYPEKNLWPAEPGTRQVARSMCAEMHAGFTRLRDAMPMNIRSSLPGKGMYPIFSITAPCPASRCFPSPQPSPRARCEGGLFSPARHRHRHPSPVTDFTRPLYSQL